MRDCLSLFTEAECCVGEAASEACWEPCYCVLLQDEQTLTAYRSEDMAVSTFFPKSLSDSAGFIYPEAFFFSLFHDVGRDVSRKTRGTDLHRRRGICFLSQVYFSQCARFVDAIRSLYVRVI